ncbi:LOW QUALITY PROTEIN: uncharacterized protein LOC117694996 [Arvicanthis niloticus]|uniref:LOW QUALITY PROTEIN: uncharacterized protein LOC117694996 n=1 Tax=Arvicanthis niloticus TaxID=61156 RepID=UPI00403CFC7E
MAQLFRYFQGDPVVTSSPTEVRMWVEELDYSFLSYGEVFESAEINGERLFNITRKQLNDLGIVRTDHQDILLQAVARIRKKSKIEEQAMHREDQNIKKMPTRFGKESEQLENAIDCVLVTISERRLARSLHGTIEQPPHSILTATLELVNIVSMILNILERPPFDCMSEFSSLKNHLINHITLLKHFSEQSDLNHENESDIIDMCKGVTKMCQYIISLPHDLPKPERQITRPAPREDRPPRVQVPITTEPETMSSSVKCKADSMPLVQHLSVPMTTASFSYGPPVQYTSAQTQIVSESYSSSPRVDSPSDEGAFTLECDKGYKSETEIQETDAFETLGGSFYYKTLQDLTIIESDTPLMDSGSEKCVIDSDSDRGVVSDFELEEQSKDFGSVIWGLYSDSETSPRDSDSRKHLSKAEAYQLDSVSVEEFIKTGKHLVRIEECQMESGSLEHWMSSGSEKSLEYSDSERFSDSDTERQKEEKFQMASTSIQHLMESEKTKMENENLWMISDSESYSVDSYTEKGRASIPKVHLPQVDETERPRTKRYMMDSDSEQSETDSDSERCELASAAVKYFMDTKTFHQSSASNQFPTDSWSERRTVNSDSESPVMSSDSMKYMKKAETCKSTCNLERLKVAHKSESLLDWLDAKRKQLDSDNAGYWDSSENYQFSSIVPQGSFGKYHGDLQTFQSITEKKEVGSTSDKRQTQFGNERDQNEPESKRHFIMSEKGLDNDGFQMDKEREGYLVESDCRDSENEAHLLEAHRLGARRKENRPPGFWRPIILPAKLAQEKKTEEQKSVQQKDNRISRIQITRYKSEDKNVRFKETSSSFSDKQLSQEKLKKKQSYSFSPESHTFTDEKHHKKASRKISVYKRHCKRYSHSCESLKYQISPIPLSLETCTSNVSSFVGSPTSKSPKSVTRKKTRRSITYSPELGAQKCTRCFMEISNSSFHKCSTNSDDSDSDSPLHGQISSYSKYSLHSKSIRHFKTSRNLPLSRSLDPQHPVVSRCSLHREDSKYSIDSTSYLHCESCSSLQNLKGSSVSHTVSKNTKEIMGHQSTDDHLKSAPVRLSQSESKFNLTAQPQNKDTPDDSDIIFISARNIKAEVNVEDKHLYKDDTDHEDETNTEDEADGEDETDTEDDTKDKKDPKDKSDPDGNDPKDGNSGNNTDSNNGSHPSGSSEPTGGPDSSNDGDSKNVTDHKSESHPTIDNATNSDVNLKYNTDEICTNNLDNASDLPEYFSYHNNADFKGSTNPASENKTRTVLDYISGSNNVDTGPRNTIIKGNIVHAKNIRLLSNSHQIVIKNESDPSSNPSPQNSYGLPKDPDSNSNINSSNATNNIANPNYGTKSTNTTINKQTVALKYYSDINDVTGFTYKVRSSFVVNSSYFDRKKYAAIPSFALTTIDAIDTHNVTTCTSAISSQFTAGKISALGTKHFPRFSHFRSFYVIIKPNYNAKNIHNANNNFTSISNINNLPATKLEINSILSVFKTICVNISNFTAGTNYSDFLITSEFYEPLELGRAYKIFDNKNIGAPSQDSAGYMDSDNSSCATGSMDALDAKESGFLKKFPRIQNTIGIKDPSSPFKVLSNQNIPLPSFDFIVEAELPDIVKFAISSGPVNQLFKLSGNYDGGSRAEGGSLAVPMREITRSSEVPVWRSAEALTWGPEGGRPVQFGRGYAVNPAKDLAVRPEQGLTMIPARGRSLSPARGYSERYGRERAMSLARGYTERQARPRTLSPFSTHAVSSPQEIALQAVRRPPVRREEEFLLGAAVGLMVKPAEGYDEETSQFVRPYTQTISDDEEEEEEDEEEEENESGSSLLMNFISCLMKAKAQNWIDCSWLRRFLPTFFSEEDRRSWSKNRFCAIAYTELGHGKCEGWLWHKRPSRGISLFSWKKYWFILKNSTLYWFSHLNDTKADGFIYLPEFRIDLAPHCRKDHAFQATHARIKDFYFAGTCLDEMNYWVCQTIKLAFGSSFGDTAANAEYRLASASVYAKCLDALKRNFPVVWCNYCQEATTIVSVNPNFQYRRTQNISDEFIYFRPINVENRERARKQKQQNPTLASQQPTPEEYSRPGTPGNLWMESPENAESPGSDDMEVARSMYPFRERSVFRRSWAELLEAPLNSEGLHILQSVHNEENRDMGCNKLISQEVIPRPKDHFQALQGPFPLLPERPKLQRQRSRSLPRYSEVRGQYVNTAEFKGNAEETLFFPRDHNVLTEENIKKRHDMEEPWQRPIPSHSGEYFPIMPRFDNSAIQGNFGIPEDNSARTRGNMRIPQSNVNTIPMVNVGIPIDNPQVLRGNTGVPRGSGFEVYVGNSGRPSRSMVSSPLIELSKIGEHQL